MTTLRCPPESTREICLFDYSSEFTHIYIGNRGEKARVHSTDKGISGALNEEIVLNVYAFILGYLFYSPFNCFLCSVKILLIFMRF